MWSYFRSYSKDFSMLSTLSSLKELKSRNLLCSASLPQFFPPFLEHPSLTCGKRYKLIWNQHIRHVSERMASLKFVLLSFNQAPLAIPSSSLHQHFKKEMCRLILVTSIASCSSFSISLRPLTKCKCQPAAPQMLKKHKVVIPRQFTTPIPPHGQMLQRL